MSTESRGKSVTTSVSSLYSKAKQRVLNKFGRRTHLTRNPKVDSLNEIQSGIRADESKLASRITSYRRSLRDAILSGLELQTLYLTIYKRNVGALKFNVERNEIFFRFQLWHKVMGGCGLMVLFLFVAVVLCSNHVSNFATFVELLIDWNRDQSKVHDHPVKQVNLPPTKNRRYLSHQYLHQLHGWPV